MSGGVVLVNPAPHRYSGFLSTHRLPVMATAHAGLPLLGAILRAEGRAVRILDEQLVPVDPTDLEGARLVGLSVSTGWAPRAYEIAAAARALGVPVVAGGAHATLATDEVLDHVDYVVRNEGERTLPDLVRAIETGGDPGAIAGLSFWRDGKKVHNPPRPFLGTAELDALPAPDWSLIEGWDDPVLAAVNRFLYFVQAGRGCPEDCTFCSITRQFGRAFRRRSVRAVLAELEARYDPGRQHLFFLDDNFVADKDYAKDLLAGLLDRKLVPRHGWHSQMRADAAEDAELVRLMRATRCLFATFGFESIEEGTLRALAKGQSPDDVRRCVRRMVESDILVNGFFMFGSDHDSLDTVDRTVRFAIDAGLTLAGFMPVTPFPGTPLFKNLEREGRIFTRDWELYDVQHVVFWPKRTSPLALYRALLGAYDRFYRAAYGLGRAWESIRRHRSLPLTLVGGSWPLAKLLAVRLETAANRDYVRALERLEASGGRETVRLRRPRINRVLEARGAKRAWRALRGAVRA